MANGYGTWTFFKRECKRFLKVWKQTLLAPVVSNLLFLAIFGLSMSRSVEPDAGLGYLEFLVPGLIMMGVINSAFQNPSSSIIIMKYQGLVADLLSIPLQRKELMLAIISSAVFRAFIVGGMTLLAAIYFVNFPYTSIIVILISTLLVSLLFGFIGLMVGICANEFDQAAFIQNFIMMPLIFLGGVFYPVSNLPGFFQKISQINPIVYMIDLLRYGFTGVNEFSLAIGLTVTAAITVATGIICYALLRSGYKLQN